MEKTPLEGLRAPLAEDQPLNAEIAAAILEEAGAAADRAEGGAIASRMSHASSEGWHDVVLMDLRLPPMDGMAVAKSIRAMDRSDAGTAPLIARTADAFAEDAQRCLEALEAGMNTRMAKPVNVTPPPRKPAELRWHRQDESGDAQGHAGALALGPARKQAREPALPAHSVRNLSSPLAAPAAAACRAGMRRLPLHGGGRGAWKGVRRGRLGAEEGAGTGQPRPCRPWTHA